MWIYKQSTGQVWDKNSIEYKPSGYAGNGKGVNNPSLHSLRNIGPLPVGIYYIGKGYDHVRLGKLVLCLEPDHSNEMFGRSHFYIHGDNSKKNGSASQGCIIAPRKTREAIDASKDKILKVVA